MAQRSAVNAQQDLLGARFGGQSAQHRDTRVPSSTMATTTTTSNVASTAITTNSYKPAESQRRSIPAAPSWQGDYVAIEHQLPPDFNVWVAQGPYGRKRFEILLNTSFHLEEWQLLCMCLHTSNSRLVHVT